MVHHSKWTIVNGYVKLLRQAQFALRFIKLFTKQENIDFTDLEISNILLLLSSDDLCRLQNTAVQLGDQPPFCNKFKVSIVFEPLYTFQTLHIIWKINNHQCATSNRYIG